MRFEIKIPIIKNNILIMDEYLNNLKGLKKHHENRYINSIYYDTEKLSLARLNIEGISERYKFRIRWYDNKTNFNYEIKKRKNKFGSKNIFSSNINLDEAEINNLFSNKSSIINSLDGFGKFILQNYNLAPKIKISYKRKYYIYKNKIRITYDYPPCYQLVNGNNKKISDNNFVLEFKFDEDNYFEALSLIKKNYFQPQRYSKYLKGLSLFNKVQYF
tara:strand:- start:812 stop:1462 length:651 start_codon:yes stop_codon:yes gene_type:complete